MEAGVVFVLGGIWGGMLIQQICSEAMFQMNESCESFSSDFIL